MPPFASSSFLPVQSKQQLTPKHPTTTPIIQLLTNQLLQTYNHTNPAFQYESLSNPKRVLTKPSKPCHNDGNDNEDWDYILYVNDLIGNQDGQTYKILDLLGQGTFGQVVKCVNIKTNEVVAIKIIKNKPAYYNQSLVEIAILEILNNKFDSGNKHHIVKMIHTFIWKNHLCIIFEMLSVNLYELIKQNGFRGLSTNLVRVFISQILDCLIILNKAKIIHCDLKPENILLKNLESPVIKVIDFGSACHENQTVYTYIQSRFYRSPEVLLGLPYTSSIDIWSLGCIAAELFLGLPLFPGSSEYNQITRITEMLGLPPSYMIEKGKQSHQFFDKTYTDGKGSYRLKGMEQYMRENNCTEHPSKRYFQGTTLEEIITNYPVTRKGLSTREVEKEMQNRQAFIDFLKGLLQLNPLERWSPQQARMHPFVTGEKYTGPFTPPARRIPSMFPESDKIVNRPRANTISSSQVDKQNVPPQLQRLVALSSTTHQGQRRGAGEPPVDDTEDEDDKKKVLLRGKSVDSHRPIHDHPPANSTGWNQGHPPMSDRDVDMTDATAEMQGGGEVLSNKVAQMDIQSSQGGNNLAMDVDVQKSGTRGHSTHSSESGNTVVNPPGLNQASKGFKSGDGVVPRTQYDADDEDGVPRMEVEIADGETAVVTAVHPAGMDTVYKTMVDSQVDTTVDSAVGDVEMVATDLLPELSNSLLLAQQTLANMPDIMVSTEISQPIQTSNAASLSRSTSQSDPAHVITTTQPGAITTDLSQRPPEPVEEGAQRRESLVKVISRKLSWNSNKKDDI